MQSYSTISSTVTTTLEYYNYLQYNLENYIQYYFKQYLFSFYKTFFGVKIMLRCFLDHCCRSSLGLLCYWQWIHVNPFLQSFYYIRVHRGISFITKHNGLVLWVGAVSVFIYKSNNQHAYQLQKITTKYSSWNKRAQELYLHARHSYYGG